MEYSRNIKYIFKEFDTFDILGAKKVKWSVQNDCMNLKKLYLLDTVTVEFT
jgi:hypothetical protein